VGGNGEIKSYNSTEVDAENSHTAIDLIEKDWEDALETDWCVAPEEFFNRNDLVETNLDILKLEEIDKGNAMIS